VRFLDLGPLAVEIDGAPRTLGGRRVESVAAALLVHAGAPVPGTALIDAVWGTDPPAGAPGALDSLIWRLRKVLEPSRAEPPGPGRGAGPSRRAGLPAGRAARRRRLARARPGRGDDRHGSGRRAATADDALRRWRGTPYDGVPDPGLEPVRTRLAEERLTVARHRLTALLATAGPSGPSRTWCR